MTTTIRAVLVVGFLLILQLLADRRCPCVDLAQYGTVPPDPWSPVSKRAYVHPSGARIWTDAPARNALWRWERDGVTGETGLREAMCRALEGVRECR